MANKRFTSIKNDFTITFEEHANIQEQNDDGSIAAQAFEFVAIKDIQDEQANRTIDLCCLVAEVSEADTIKLKSGAEKLRRQVTLADDSNCAIGLTIWGSMCDKLTESDVGKVVAIKGVRVSDYLGKSLNSADDHSTLFTTLEHERVRKLRAWYGQQRPFSLEEFRNLTLQKDRPNQQMNEPIDRAEQKNSNLNLISEINEAVQRENDTDQQHFYFVNGYISRIKNDERIFYPACMTENCRRKVVEEAQGFRCENCQKSFMSYRPTYMITAKLSDFTDSIYVNFAREQGDKIMGKTAE